MSLGIRITLASSVLSLALLGCSTPAAPSGSGDESASDGSDPDASGDSGHGDPDSTAGTTTDPSTTDDPDGSTTDEPPSDPGIPPYDEVEVHTLDLPVLGDPTDLYVPAPIAPNGPLPVALLLQGANVDKQYYSDFATLVARHGFIVVIPNHTSSGVGGTGLFIEQSVVVDALAGVVALSDDPRSVIAGLVDPDRAGLLGHSYGGVVGIYALTGECTFPFCTGSFTLPASVKGGAFYGTTMRSPFGGPIPPVPNDGHGIALVHGTVDGVAELADAVGTYENIETPPAALVRVLGATHYGLTNVEDPAGAEADPATPTLDQATGIETSARYSALLLRAWVLEDAAAQEHLDTHVDSNATIEQR